MKILPNIIIGLIAALSVACSAQEPVEFTDNSADSSFHEEVSKLKQASSATGSGYVTVFGSSSMNTLKLVYKLPEGAIPMGTPRIYPSGTSSWSVTGEDGELWMLTVSGYTSSYYIYPLPNILLLSTVHYTSMGGLPATIRFN